MKFIIFSAPSGSGKTTIIRKLIAAQLPLEFSVSATSRPLRGTEVDGRDYYFYSAEEFKQLIDNQKLIEWEEVYENRFYGTLKSEIERASKLGKHLVFDVDVMGGLRLKQLFGNKALALFIQAPTIETLKQRLESRSTDTPTEIAARLAKAKKEMSYASKFDNIIINENIEQAVAETKTVILNFINQTL